MRPVSDGIKGEDGQRGHRLSAARIRPRLPIVLARTLAARQPSERHARRPRVPLGLPTFPKLVCWILGTSLAPLFTSSRGPPPLPSFHRPFVSSPSPKRFTAAQDGHDRARNQGSSRRDLEEGATLGDDVAQLSHFAAATPVRPESQAPGPRSDHVRCSDISRLHQSAGGQCGLGSHVAQQQLGVSLELGRRGRRWHFRV